MGAWIEIFVDKEVKEEYKSLPLWERGLKFIEYKQKHGDVAMSLPLWERGLKFQNKVLCPVLKVSLPLWERGLK